MSNKAECPLGNHDCPNNIELHAKYKSAHDTFLLHIVMIVTALVLIIFSMVMHHFNNDDQFYMTIGIAAIGFLFGKFTNNFGGLPRQVKKGAEE